MVSSLEAPVRAQSASLSLPATGGESRVTQVAFPLVYSGPTPSKVLAFAAASAGEAVEVELSWEDGEASWKGIVKLRGAKLVLPTGDDEKPKVVLALVLAREDVREPRELLEFLLAAVDGEALELDLHAKVVQPPLPFASDEDAEDGPAPARRRRPKGSSPPPAG